MKREYLNPNWLLSRILEKCGIKDYTERCEFAAHFFAGCTFALLGLWTAILWATWTLIDEFAFDGWKGKDTVIDLSSKLFGPFVLLIFTIW